MSACHVETVLKNVSVCSGLLAVIRSGKLAFLLPDCMHAILDISPLLTVTYNSFLPFCRVTFYPVSFLVIFPLMRLHLLNLSLHQVLLVSFRKRKRKEKKRQVWQCTSLTQELEAGKEISECEASLV